MEARQPHFSVKAEPPSAVPIEVEPIPAEELVEEEKRITRLARKRQRGEEMIREAERDSARLMDKRKKEHQDGPATLRMKHMAEELISLVAQKKKLEQKEATLFKRMVAAGVDAQFEVIQLQNKEMTAEQALAVREAEN